MSLEITFLGTGSAYPMPRRGASCIIFRLEGIYWMFDCGEGSQIQLMRSSIRAGRISKMFITHLHGDHMFGLPGLMCTVSQNAQVGSNQIVELYGPVGLRKYVRTSLELSRSQLGFSYVVHELQPIDEQQPEDCNIWPVEHEAVGPLHPNELPGRTIVCEPDGLTWNVFEDKSVTVTAGRLKHRIASFGYVIQESSRPGKMDISKLQSMGIQPGPLYRKLKAGESVTAPNGEVIRSCDVVFSRLPGRKVAILGDSCDSRYMVAQCRDADVIIHEATLANEMEANAIEKGHSTPDMAGRFAEDAHAGCLVLTHFSQRFKPQSSNVKEGDDCVETLRIQAQRSFTSGQVIAADDFSVITVLARTDPNVRAVVSVHVPDTETKSN